MGAGKRLKHRSNRARALGLGTMIVWMFAQAAVAVEQPSPPTFAGEAPRYPGLYVDAWLSYSPRDEVFDANRHRRLTALPNTPGRTEFPQTELAVSFQWYFPLFESQRLFTARTTLRAAYTRTQGALADFTSAHGLNNSRSGFGDLSFAFGGFLLGSAHWRSHAEKPYALMLTLGTDVPTGEHDANAPNNVGSNRVGYFAELGGHWRATSGWFVDASVRYEKFGENREPAFGALEPTQLGDLLSTNLAVNTHIGGLYVGSFAEYQRGQSNLYVNPRFSTNPPPPSPGMDQFPAPGRYRDGGTGLLSIGGVARYFLTENLVVSFSLIQPIDGKSGQFVLPFQQQPSGCRFTDTCSPTAAGSTVQDGFGAARAYASTIFALGLNYRFARANP